LYQHFTICYILLLQLAFSNQHSPISILPLPMSKSALSRSAFYPWSLVRIRLSVVSRLRFVLKLLSSLDNISAAKSIFFMLFVGNFPPQELHAILNGMTPAGE